MLNKKFKLFSSCFPVKGVNQGVVIDIQRQNYYLIPNQIIDILIEYSSKKIYDLFRDFKDDKHILKKYIRFFITNELLIVSNDVDRFPAINTDFVRPYSIDTLNLELGISHSILKDVLKEKIEKLGISNIRLICRDFDLAELYQILKIFNKSRVKSIILYLEYDVTKEDELIKLQNKFIRLAVVIFYKARIENETENSQFVYDRRPLEEILSMKITHRNNFSFSIQGFIESLHYNSAYNRTIYIDSLGNIKRHLNDESVFGNLSSHDLETVILNEGIVNFWNISKDKVKICRDCEFRYICPDGSIPLISEDGSNYVKSHDCIYDPYTNIWR
ncbi:grasp-with-spasm system SPASM domain peptide maturase [Flavobacterium notoginsengisoli]|uniref:grasp-with-spasm system SPASM domain peptide maturase n=1 Tax=Flavobacterium notoginsengisoli TaxID=1478199 RepID=UPI003635DBED